MPSPVSLVRMFSVGGGGRQDGTGMERMGTWQRDAGARAGVEG